MSRLHLWAQRRQRWATPVVILTLLASSLTAPAVPPVQAAVAGDHEIAQSCAIAPDGTLVCWGLDDYGQATAPGGTYTAVEAGFYHTCAIQTDGTLACWGLDTDGQATPPSGAYTDVSAGAYHTCAIKTDGTLACWGDNEFGQTGAPAGTYFALSAGTDHTCALATDGTIACWGRDEGSGVTSPPAGSYRAIASGENHSCAIDSGGTLACWGVAIAADKPMPLTGTYVALVAGHQHYCAIDADGALACWGADLLGQATPPAGTYKSLIAGGHHTCAVNTSDAVACWGESDFGQTTPPSGTFFGSAVPSVPAAPTGATATAGAGQALVSWIAPLDDGGRAITGYTVTSSPDAQTCATGGGLSCTVSGLTGGTGYTFTVTAANEVGTGPASAPSSEVTAGFFHISGTVTDPDGAPLDNVEVRACPAPFHDWRCSPDHQATTGVDGTYTVVGLEPGDYVVTFDGSPNFPFGFYSSSGYVRDRDNVTPVSITDSDVTGIDMELPLGHSVSGTVTGPDAQPVAGINVGACLATWWGDCEGATTAADGTYTIVNVGPGTSYFVMVSGLAGYGQGFYTTSGFTSDFDSATRIQVDGDLTGIDVQVPFGYAISGTVTGPGGVPLSGIQVSASDHGAWSDVVTASDGTYVITSVAPGSHTVFFEDPEQTYLSGYYGDSGFTPDEGAATLVGVPPDASGIDVQMRLASGSISGTVTGPGGVPLENIEVRACPVSNPYVCLRVLSAVGGTYLLDGLPLQPTVVSFYDMNGIHASGFYSDSGFTPDRNAATVIDLIVGDATGIDVELPLGLTLSGTITGPGGVPLGDLDVWACYWFPGVCNPTRTAGDGTYTVRGLVAGSYIVQLRPDSDAYANGFYSDSGFVPDEDFATEVVITTADVSGIDVELPPGYSISGTVTGPGGVPLAGIWADICWSRHCNRDLTAADGTYTLRSLAAGSYRVGFGDDYGTYPNGFYSDSGWVRYDNEATAVGVPPDATGIDVELPAWSPPGAPTDVVAVGGNNSALVSWTAPADSGSSPVNRYVATSSPEGMTCEAWGELSCTVGGLTNGTSYTFTVNASNDEGTGPESAPSNAVTPGPTAPGAPIAVVATRGNASAHVSWSAPFDGGGSAITAYEVTSSPDGMTCSSTGALGCDVTGLTNGTAYTFTVTATNDIGTGPASEPSNEVTPSVDAPLGPTVVRWFVGLGSGSQPNQIAAQVAFLATYNNTNTDGIRIDLEIVPNADAAAILEAEIAADNAPDLVGPVGVRSRVGFNDDFLDLSSLISSHGTDLSDFDPELFGPFQNGAGGQIGLPYLVYPGYIFYNKDIFAAAGLPDLPTTVGQTYQGDSWTWDKLAQVARSLTVDSSGRHPDDPGFDSNHIVTFGMDFQWTDARRMASTFGGGTFVAPDGVTAQIPDAYRDAWSWYYDAIWTSHFAPNGGQISTDYLRYGTTVSSGHIAMNAGWAWEIPSYGQPGNAAFGSWGIAVMPSWDGQTSSPMDADTLAIMETSTNPDAAYLAMLAIEADPTLKTVYGGMPARNSEQAAYFASREDEQAAAFPGNTVTWSVLHEMAHYPTLPSHEGEMPAYFAIVDDYNSFWSNIQNNPGLDINAEIETLRLEIQNDLTPPAGSISGTVTGPGGVPLAGIDVEACSETPNWSCYAATTAADGAYTVLVYESGDYRIRFADPDLDYATGYYSVSGFTGDVNVATIVAVPPDATGIDVELPVGLTISGTIAMPDGYQPIEVSTCGGVVYVGSICTWATAAPDGTYTLRGLPAGFYVISFNDWSGTYASGYWTASGLTGSYDNATRVSVPPDATGIDIELPLGLTISGTVTGPGGIQLEGIGVDACPVDNGMCAWAYTAPDGSYTVRGLAPGSYLVHIGGYQAVGGGSDVPTYASGYWSTGGLTGGYNSATPVNVPPDATGIDVELPLGLTISGTVTGPGGIPLESINVDACIIDGGCRWASTAPDGTYTVGGLLAGSYRVQFWDNYNTYNSGYYGGGSHLVGYQAATYVTVPPDATGIDVELAPWSPPGAPTDVVAVAGNGSATVSWNAPADDGTINWYQVISHPGDLTCWSYGELSCTVTGLTNGVTYTFTVMAGNDAGDGPQSAPSNAVTPAATLPGAPIAVVATRGNASAHVGWSAPFDDGGDPIEAYTVTSSPGGRACTSLDDLGCDVAGLTNGVSYTFTVTATNGVGTGPASAPSNAVTPSADAPANPVVVRWFIGLGNGSQPNQIADEVAFLATYNNTNTEGIRIDLELVPNADAVAILKSEIASGNAPDLVGPVGIRGRNPLGGAFLDLSGLIAEYGTDLDAYDPALVDFFNQPGEGQIGLPYNVYPGYIFYNKDLFSAAGLPDLPHSVGDTYQGDAWTWDKLAEVGIQLTVDSSGRHPTDPGFDSNDIVQFGFDAQWSDGRRLASCFEGGTFLDADGHTAVIPQAYRDAWSWYYDAIWTDHFAASGQYINSPLLNNGMTVSSGRVAMEANWSWAMPYYGNPGGSAFEHWDIAVMPSYDGQTSSPLDADTFTITRASTHPDEAYQAMLAIMADPTLLADYGGMPGKTADQAAWFDMMDAQIAASFPNNDPIDWSVLTEMSGYPAVPSHESRLPNETAVIGHYSSFYTTLQNTPGLDLEDELEILRQQIQSDFDGSAPIAVIATAGNASAHVSWSAPFSVSAPISYTVTSDPGGLTCTTAGPLACTVTGLTNGVTYTFTVQASYGTGSASAPSNAVIPSADAPASPTAVRWFIGLGTGTQPNQIAAQTAFVATYNNTNTEGIRIDLELVPNADAVAILKSEIASGNAPDIVGPVGTKGRNGFGGAFLDLSGLIAEYGTDLDAYDPALVDFFNQGGEGQIGLPYNVYPGYIFYNKDLFSAAGLPDLPHSVGDTYQGDAWTWDKLAEVGVALTLDSSGRHPTDPGFDSDNIVQFGFDAQWSDGRRLASCFEGGTFLDADGHTAVIPQAYRDAWSWYYDAIWTSQFAPSGQYVNSPLLNYGTTVSSGRIAMNAAWPWEISSYGQPGASAFEHWDIAVMPSYDGQTSSPLDADTFTITRASAHPDEAYRAMLAIMADPTLLALYGGIPARTADQAVWFDMMDDQIAAAFPNNDPIDWSVLTEMLSYPAVPSHESDMPNATAVINDYSNFYTNLQNNPGLNLEDELEALRLRIQADFDGVSTPSAPRRVHATAGNGSASVSWTVPTYLGTSAVTGYAVTASPGAATCSTFGALSCTVSGLTNGTTYTFIVTATTATGPGTASAPSNAVTPIGAPGAPGIAGVFRGNGQAVVFWNPPVDAGGSPITSYTVSGSPSGTCTSALTFCLVTGLTNGTTYTFTVTATNAAGTGPASEPSDAVTPATVPDAPTDVVAVRGNTQATVSWTAPAFDGGSAITRYTVTSSPDALHCTWTSGPLSCTVSGLTNGTAHTFTVTATNDVGTGAASAPSNSVTPATVPGAPTDVVAARDNASADVSWTAPASDGGSAMSGYTVTSSPGGFTCTSATTSCTVAGLTNGTAYTFTVTATNDVGTGAASAPSNSVTPAIVPGAPTGVIATRGNTQANVSWTAPASDGGSAITGYTVTSSPGGFTCTSATTSCTVSGLTNGTAYTFTVTATNDVGTGAASDPSNSVTPATVPGAPTGVVAARDNASADVSWTAPADSGGSPVTGYTATSSPGGLTCTTATTSCTVAGLTNGTAYTFTVTASNAAGVGPASEASSEVTPATVPGAPTNVVAARGDTQATISWAAPDNGGSTIFLYTVSASDGYSNCMTAVTSCTVSGLTNGTAYTFTVTATNVIGTGAASDPSNSVTPATVPGAPTGVVAVRGNASANATWTAPASDGGSAITGYTVTSSPGGLTCTTAATSCTVSGLTNGTAYTFTVTATNDVGTGASSAASNSVTPATVPGAPTGVVAVRGNASATVSWTAPSNNGSPITAYAVTSDPGGLTCTWTSGPLTCTISGLTNGTAYAFTVTATNDVGTGPASVPSNGVTPATVPGAPTDATAVRGNASADVSWTAPADNGGSVITGYTVTSSPGGLTCTTATTGCTVSGLTNGTAYAFTVTATNGVGTGSASAPSNSVTPATVPGAPTGVVATRGNTQATVSWTAPASGGSSITGYTVSSSPGALTCAWTSGPLTCTISGLTNGTAYTFTVTATNDVGTGASSAASNSVTPATVPDVPTDVVAAGGNASASVNWDVPAFDGGSAITGYTVTSSPGGLTCTAATPTCTVTGLTNGTAYTFTVTATNDVGTGASSAASNSVTPATVPGAPTNVVAVGGNTQASVSWTAPAFDGGSAITGYTVTSSPGGLTCTTAATSCTVTGLTNGTAYTFTVTATNDVGTGAASAPSNSVTPATVPGATANVVAVRGNASAIVFWTPPVDVGGSPITSYTVSGSPDGTCTTSLSFCVVTGLTNGVGYTFTVSATNAAGTGPASEPSSQVTPATVPGAPTDVVATRGNTQATISWTAPADNGGAAIFLYTVSASGGLTCMTAATYCTVPGLTNGAAYTFTVTATNVVGTGAPSAASNSVTPATVPGAPTSVTAARGNASADVSWTAPASDGGSAITGYTVTSNPGGLTCTTATTSCTVPGLTNGTAYTFTVTATNEVGTGPASAASNSVTPAIVPGAPTGATAVRGNTQASISWTAPASNGGSVITGYTVTSTPGSFTCTSTGALTCTVTGLTNGTAYTFTVTATNVVGTGAPSAASNSVTPATVPGAPTGAVATRGNASASLSWTAPADNGGSAITGYTVTSNPDGSTCTTTASSNCTVTGLTNGTAYTFTVTATNDVGTGAASAASNSVTPATVPGAPTGVSGLRGDAQVTVSWTAPASNGGSAITGYTVTSSPGSFTCTTTGALTCTVTGLTNGSSYTFTVTATNDVGTGAASAPSSPVTLGTAPGAPTGVAAVAGNASATVSWTAPASDGGLAITGYTVTSSPGGFTCTTATTSCTVTSLTNGTWYTFTVRATNATGTGPASASSTPVIPQPPMTRYSGSDKYATAAAVSANTFPAHCGCTAYIAYADNFPDALAGAAAAGTVKGPVLFVAASGAINSSTATELTRLAPDRIVVLGSNMAISDAVFNVLKAYAPTGQTFRYSGSNRFATAAAVSANTFSADCHCTAYVAYAMNFPDALAAAAAAGMVPGPVLLVATTGAINTATATELTRLHPDHIVVVGSPSVVSAAVFNALKAYAPTGQTFRYYGTSRYATAASISSHTFAADCGCVVYVSAGTDFNGALSAAAAAGTLKGPLLIVGATGALDTSVAAELTRLQPVRIVVVGNTSTVSPAVYNLLAAYAPTS